MAYNDMSLLQRMGIALNKGRWNTSIARWLSGQDISDSKSLKIDVSGVNSLKYSAVFSCCRVLAETFATVPIFEYRKNKNGEREKTDATGLYDTLHNKFNDDISAYNGKEMSMYQLNLGGNCFFIKGKNSFGEVKKLTPVLWPEVEMLINEKTKRLEYKIKGIEGALTKEDIFHVPGPSYNGLIGMTPITYVAAAIQLGRTYDIFSKNYYENGALSSGFFEHPGELKEEPFSRLKEQLENNWTGLRNSGKPMLLESGLKFSPIQLKLVDAELLSSKKFQIEDIARVFRVPLHLIQNLDKATNNNIEHQSLEFVMYTMLPHFKRFEENINMQLLTEQQRRDGYYFEFNVNTLLRGDQKSMAEAFATGRQWGWLSVNDVRRLLNLNSIENGDIYLQPLNMAEAGAVEDQKGRLIDEAVKTISERGN
jgi:HK97 family phage portal protein